ncbi:carboxylesterase type B [Usnea florida]
MHFLLTISFLLSLSISAASISVSSKYSNGPPTAVYEKRQQSENGSSSLLVDLGYELYEGVADNITGFRTWKGIRYAAPPTGALRWQAPQAPAVSRGKVLAADTIPPRCPQNPMAPGPQGFNFTGDEDCLFLSVYAPANAINLPVLVFIHGGGYGEGQGNSDLTPLISDDGNSFIGVVIQYRLGAFGFLSSEDVMRNGVVNGGLLDQHFALKWVQSYIGLFGGNASRVTVSGESAGAGSVMLQAMAFGGTLGDSLFINALAASPFLQQQYRYDDAVPSQKYYAFASAAGCLAPSVLPQYNTSDSIFQCLVTKDTITLQNASATVSGVSRYGTWAFVPVTDGLFVQQLPSQQLLKMQVNGNSILVGNNANEGPLFTPQDILTEDDFVDFLKDAYPLFTNYNISQILQYYPSTNSSVSDTPKFATSGTSTPTAVNESTFGTGQQQRADNVYAESTFVCPSYWLADAFTGHKRKAYKYQYSVIGAEHGADLSSYGGSPTPNQGPAFNKAFMTIFGNFITTSNPSISAQIANGVNSTSASNPASAWPPWNLTQPYQINLNESGGTPFEATTLATDVGEITEFGGPGLKNKIELVNAYTWEGGRGARCDFWRSVGAIVPE